MKLISCLTFLFCFFTQIAHAQKPDYQKRVLMLNDNIQKHFYQKDSGLYLETNGKNDKPFSFLWPLCALIQGANEAEAMIPNSVFMKPVLNAISQYYNTNPPAPGYQAYLAKDGNDSRFYDDNQWIAIALLDAYNRTGEKSYLAKAEELYRFMMTGYDDKSGGGLYWKEDEKNTKNTCSNGPGILIALQLYKITKTKEYLTTALDLYQWTNKHLRDSDGIYWDAIKIPGMKLDSTKYTYNTGTMLQSNALLYQITKEKKYLKEAVFIAKSAESFFYKKGRLPDHYWFNVVLLRGYEELYKIDNNKKRFQFFITDAERIWNEERDQENLMGPKPKKGLIDQAAMMEMYARLARLQ
jgi:rhamnogalacturonyl hydrolase YesR